MAIHDIQQPTTSGKYAGCVYVTGMGRVFVPGLGFFDQVGFDVVMGASGSWWGFVGHGPAWAHGFDRLTDKQKPGDISQRDGMRFVAADCLAGRP